MKQIFIHNSLDIDQNELITSSLFENNEVFLKQGSIDGACGLYCLFMALLILGEIDRSEATEFWNIKRSTRFGKLISVLEDHSLLFNEGTDISQLQELLKHYSKKLSISYNTAKGKETIKFVLERQS